MRDKSLIKDIARTLGKTGELLKVEVRNLKFLINRIEEGMRTIRKTLKEHEIYFGQPEPLTKLASLLVAINKEISAFKQLRRYKDNNKNDKLRNIGTKAETWLGNLEFLRNKLRKGEITDYFTARAYFNSYIIQRGMSPVLQELGVEEKAIWEAERMLGISTH